MVMQPAIAGTDVGRSPGPSGLADVLELILDKGLVIDAFVRVSLIGIELLTIDARIVVASVDTYLRFAEAVNRLDLNEVSGGAKLQDLGSGRSSHGPRRSEARGALSGAKEKASEAKEDVFGGSDDDSTEDATAEDEERATAEDEERGTDQEAADRPGIAARIKDRGKVY